MSAPILQHLMYNENYQMNNDAFDAAICGRATYSQLERVSSCHIQITKAYGQRVSIPYPQLDDVENGTLSL